MEKEKILIEEIPMGYCKVVGVAEYFKEGKVYMNLHYLENGSNNITGYKVGQQFLSDAYDIKVGDFVKFFYGKGYLNKKGEVVTPVTDIEIIPFEG